MIRRFIDVIFGNGLVETTPFSMDVKKEYDTLAGFGVSMKNLTDAECVGDIKLMFIDDASYDFFIRKLNEAKLMRDTNETKRIK